MILFDRTYKVKITSTSEVIEIEDLRVSFEIKKDDSSTQNSLELKIYNLGRTLRAKLEEKDLTIELLAGYANIAELIFKGDMAFAIHKKQGPDLITTIHAKDGAVAMREQVVTESFAEGTTVQQIIDKITGSFNLPIKEIASDLTGSFANGFSVAGPLKTIFNKMSKSFGFDWSVQDGELQITKTNALLNDIIIVLNANTGLIGIPEKLTSDGDKMTDDPTIIPNGVLATSLLLPSARPGRRLNIESDVINGDFRITEVSHTGDNRGPKWFTIIKADLL